VATKGRLRRQGGGRAYGRAVGLVHMDKVEVLSAKIRSIFWIMNGQMLAWAMEPFDGTGRYGRQG